jgi:serine/threonine protein kinase
LWLYRSFEALSPYPHPNVVTAYGVCTDAPDGQLRIVMELCVKSLWDLLDEQKPKVRCLTGLRSDLSKDRCTSCVQDLRAPHGLCPFLLMMKSSPSPSLWCQGGFSLALVLTVIRQVVAGLHHLHRLGILHRDVRAANVLVASLDPLRVVLADFGLSHMHGRVATALRLDDVQGRVSLISPSLLLPSILEARLFGRDALGPLLWMAPEERAVSEAGSVTSPAGDVYMTGGLLYELLTGGTSPYHWLLVHVALLIDRMRTSSRVPIPGAPGLFIDGLLGKHVLEVAAADGVAIPWCVRGPGAVGGAEVLRETRTLLERCWANNSSSRPTTAALLDELQPLLEHEVAVALATGTWDALLGAPVLAPYRNRDEGSATFTSEDVEGTLADLAAPSTLTASVRARMPGPVDALGVATALVKIGLSHQDIVQALAAKVRKTGSRVTKVDFCSTWLK